MNAPGSAERERGIVSGSATTLTIIPGDGEGSSRRDGDACTDHHDGCPADETDDLDSAMPDYWGKGLDAWFLGDQRSDLPTDLDEALAVTKTFPEYPGEEFRAYRLKNHLSVSFRTTDGRTIDDWESVDVALDEEKPSYVCVEGETEHGEGNAMRTLIERPPSDFWSWFDGREKARAHVIRYDGDVVEDGTGYAPRNEDLNRVAVDGPGGERVEGVRVSAIVGGQDSYIRKLNELFYRDPVRFQREFPDSGPEDVPSFVQTPPTMYTFLGLVVMADGTTAARVWDSSPYPQHFLYVNGEREPDGMDNGFVRGDGLGLTGTVEDGNWVRNQDMNLERFVPWVNQSTLASGHEPFSPHSPRAYEENWDSDTPGITPQSHPTIAHAEDGDVLSAETVLETFDSPLFPWSGSA
ncbi:hypothetical protein [Halomicrobium salinisoli]|uniref:hypothetical protein n=1 Tax=Halomicrobium salinisoli TaxID=2878391 RepID=UPI001CF0037B|nr:hypothetical protein [Halomicrobium salinisoli]